VPAPRGIDAAMQPYQLAPQSSPNGGWQTDEGAGGLDWKRYLAAVLRYKWVIAVVLVLGGLGGFMVSRFRPPTYEAQATVLSLIESPGPEPISPGQLLADVGWIDLMKSFTVLDEAVRGLRLYVQYKDPADSLLYSGFALQPSFAPGEYQLEVAEDGQHVALVRDGFEVENVSLGDSIGTTVGFAWMPEPAYVGRAGTVKEFEVQSPRDIAAHLQAELQVQTARGANFIHVRLQGANPVRIAATVNSVLDRFIDVAAEIKRATLTERTGILREQLANAERNLRSAEEALERFRVATITEPRDRRGAGVAPGLEETRDPVLSDFFDMQLRRAGLQRDQESIERALADRAEGGWNPLALETVASARANSDLSLALTQVTEKRAELRALQTQFTDAHPQIQRLSEELRTLETVEVPRLAEALLADLRFQENNLERQLGSASTDMEEIPRRAIQEARLSRDVDIAEMLYSTLQSKYEESRLAEMSTVPDVSVLDPAVVPQRPVRDEGPRFILLGLMAGFGIGVFGAIVLDYFDRRVRYPSQVAVEMGLPILGAIPHLKAAGRNGARGGDAGPVIEAFRGIRMSLTHTNGTGATVITVTSPGSGDGKSFVASNLALSLADAGVRTVLIDGDTRKGTQHRILSLARKPGLTDYLAGTCKLGDALQTSSFAHLSFLGGGTRMARAPELLGSPIMRGLISELRGRFEAIIVDSPPMGAGVDSFMLGSVTGSLMLVLRTGKTDRAAAEAKLDMIERFPIRLVGAVLNGVKPGHGDEYRYYQYYMPGYDYDVEPEEEVDIDLPQALTDSGDAT
jgi:capsular exopolysaccharide synthesis family protein